MPHPGHRLRAASNLAQNVRIRAGTRLDKTERQADQISIRRLFARLPSAADYALLSPSVRHYAYGAPQRRASVAGRPMPGTAALNELSAPVLTIHDVPYRVM